MAPATHPNRSPIRLYLITDRTQMRGRPLLEVVAAALRGGVDAVQLREKDATARELVEWGRALRRLCDEHGARLLINDRIDVALAVDADGAHLPATSFLVADARRLLGNRLIGVSCHSLAEIDAVRGADFAVLGPIYATPSKAAYGAPLGPVTLEAAVGRAAMPVLAIGGIDTARAAEVRARGAAGIAVIRAICAADDPTAATVALRREPPPR